jgi:hypothetical protein
LLDFGLAGEVLFVSADAKIDAGDFHGLRPGWVYRTWLSPDGAANNDKADVSWLCQNWPSILAVTGHRHRAAVGRSRRGLPSPPPPEISHWLVLMESHGRRGIVALHGIPTQSCRSVLLCRTATHSSCGHPR